MVGVDRSSGGSSSSASSLAGFVARFVVSACEALPAELLVGGAFPRHRGGAVPPLRARASHCEARAVTAPNPGARATIGAFSAPQAGRAGAASTACVRAATGVGEQRTAGVEGSPCRDLRAEDCGGGHQGQALLARLYPFACQTAERPPVRGSQPSWQLWGMCQCTSTVAARPCRSCYGHAGLSIERSAGTNGLSRQLALHRL